MFRRLGAMLVLVLVLGGIGLSRPSTALAFTNPSDPDGNPYTVNLAGRPVNGFTYNDVNAPWQWACNDGWLHGWGTAHGIAYGKVGSQLVLFYPYHARASACFNGYDVFGPNNSIIGYYGADICYNGDCASYHDLSVIYLYQGNWPTSLNRIYRGSQADGSSPYWLITDPESPDLSCPGYADQSDPLGFGDEVAQNFQRDLSTYWSFRDAIATGWNFYEQHTGYVKCGIQTNLQWHNSPHLCPPEDAATACPYRDSGAPWVDMEAPYAHTIAGITTGRDGNGYLFFTPIYEGIKAIYHREQQLGTTAFFCKTSDCSG